MGHGVRRRCNQGIFLGRASYSKAFSQHPSPMRKSTSPLAWHLRPCENLVFSSTSCSCQPKHFLFLDATVSHLPTFTCCFLFSAPPGQVLTILKDTFQMSLPLNPLVFSGPPHFLGLLSAQHCSHCGPLAFHLCFCCQTRHSKSRV